MGDGGKRDDVGGGGGRTDGGLGHGDVGMGDYYILAAPG